MVLTDEAVDFDLLAAIQKLARLTSDERASIGDESLYESPIFAIDMAHLDRHPRPAAFGAIDAIEPGGIQTAICDA